MTRTHAARVDWFSDISKIITGLRLDLHDVCAHVSQSLRAIGTENDRRHVSDTNVRKDVGARHGRLRFICFRGAPQGILELWYGVRKFISMRIGAAERLASRQQTAFRRVNLQGLLTSSHSMPK